MLRRRADMVRLRLRSLFGRRRVEAELDLELRQHLEQETAENVARGMAPDAARLAALRAFGGVEAIKEEVRDTRGTALVESLVRDLRYTLRGLLRQPMLVLAASGSIALGVGGNIAVFSLADALLFAAPTSRQPEELVQVGIGGGSHVSYQRWAGLNESRALDGIAGFQIEDEVNWLHGDAAVSIVPMLVTANFFDVTGVPVAQGRAFSATEARAELDPHLVVVSDGFWRQRLGGDSGAVGSTLILNGEPYTILGVLPARFRSVAGYGLAPSVYLPLSRALVPDLSVPNAPVVQLVGRLKEGQSLGEGRAALDAVARRLGRLDGDTLFAGVDQFGPLRGPRRAVTFPVVGAFFALLAFVSFLVLLLACANVAGLLLARGTARRREIAVRLALGAGRGRLLQHLLVEGLWLALLGTAGGLALNLVFMRVVDSLSLPIALPLEPQLLVDPPTLLAAVGLMLLALVLGALAPALRASRITLTPALRQEEPQYATRRVTLRGLLLAGQVTVSTVLLVAAFLFLRNVARTSVMDPGFEVAHSLVAQVGFVQGRSTAEQRAAFLRDAVERVRGLPGVRSATYANAVPLTMRSGSLNGASIRIDGTPEPVQVEFARAMVGPGYFATMGIRLLEGREFQASEGPGTPSVAIVNAEFARRYLAGKSPVGRRVRFSQGDVGLGLEIVGLVADSKYRTLGEDQRAAVYQPLRQRPEELRIAYVLARMDGGPDALLAPVRRAIGELDPSTAVEVQPMRAALAFAVLPSRIGAAVLITLGMLGLVLAMLGLYAVVSYAVSRRVGEIAIRVALGATTGRVIRLVITDTALLVGVGLALGLAISAFVTRPLAAFLVAGLSPSDPVSFGGTAVTFVLVSLLASWLPARRAARIDPALAMRLD